MADEALVPDVPWHVGGLQLLEDVVGLVGVGPADLRTYPRAGRRGCTGLDRSAAEAAWEQPACTRYASQMPMPSVIANHMNAGSLGICSMAGPPSPENSGWNFSWTRKPAAASMPTRQCASSASRHVRTWSKVRSADRLNGSNSSNGAIEPGRP